MEKGRYAQFPREEYLTRYDSIRRRMEQRGIDALLITEQSNYEWLTGHLSQQNPIDKIRPYIFVLPADGDPILVTMSFEVGTARGLTWVDRIKTYSSFDQAVDVIRDTVEELGISNGTIGCELGREQYLGIPYNTFETLRASLPNAQFTDASELILESRSIKSDREIEYCRSAAEITAESLQETFTEVEPGMTNQDVAHILRQAFVKRGAENITFMAILSGYNLSEGGVYGPVDRTLEYGDSLVVDTGIRYKGYCSDVARTAVIGEADDRQREIYESMVEIQNRCHDRMEPGTYCYEIYETCVEELQQYDIDHQAVGRIGHGVGCESTEFPSLSASESVELQRNMILTCNPNFTTEVGCFNREDELLVTDDGVEIISKPEGPEELVVID